MRASYEGASPETMDAEVTSIIEGAISRVPGIRSIESSSEENNSRIRVEFQPYVDLNVAANDVREAVSRNQRQLPEEVEEVFVIKADDDADAIIQLAATSDTLSKEELAKRIEKDVAPNLLSTPGVADVRLNGAQQRVMRVLLDPARLAGQNISTQEVIEVLRNARLDVPAGSYESEDQELIVRAYASVVEPERIENLYIRDRIRLSDVGVVFYGPERADSYTMLNGSPVIGVGIVRQAGSNTIAISNAVRERVDDINHRAREFKISVISDDAVFIEGAISEVLFSLGIAVVIVLVVIAVFLGQWRATLIPAVTMPISLIGTIAAIWLMGFSVNLLTLLALVLATGLIVDDAIVVLENIQRHRSLGSGKMAAAVIGTRQVFFAVIATTVTLASVFLPIAFLPSQTGQLFREFGLVLSVAVIISSIVALTLCPMMASRLPSISGEHPALKKLQDRLHDLGASLSNLYFTSLAFLLARAKQTLMIAIAVVIAGGVGFMGLSKELLPQEDRGMLRIVLTGPDGASLSYSDRQAEKVEAILAPYQDAGYITDIMSIVGRWDKNRAYITASLKPWEERDVTQMELAAEINQKLREIPGAQVRVFGGNSLGVRGGATGIEVALTGNTYEDIYAAASQFSQQLKDAIPTIEDVRVQFDTSQPELSFRIDRERANDLNVALDAIAQTLRVMVDRYDVIDLSVEDESVPIMVSSIEGAANDPGDLLNMFVTNRNGDLVPLTSLVTIEEAGVAAELDRHAQRRAIELDIGIAPGTSLGDAVSEIEALAKAKLPSNVNILLVGEAATLDETSHDMTITFLLAFLVVFIVLAAQFESVGSALIVIFTVPFGLAAAVFALMLTGQSINLYSQIGLVMLVGL
ncbi:MAG: efflux RND transporter permease subunit, partial [Rickettsiales bacterium]